MLLNFILIILFVLSLYGFSKLQEANRLRAFLIGFDDPILKQTRFKYLMIHLNRMSPEYRELLSADPFNSDLWERQFFNDADRYWSQKLNLTPEQMASIREKKGYEREDGTWVSVSSSTSSDSTNSDADFGGGGGFDGGGAGGDF